MSSEPALPTDLPCLPEGWEWRPLESYVCNDRGICYGIVQPGEAVPDGVPFVRVKDFQDSRVSLESAKCVAPSVEAGYSRSRLQGGEILLSLVGTLGLVAVAPVEFAGSNVARAVGVIPVDIETARFVAICLRSEVAQRYIKRWATTTVQATLNLRDVKHLPIPHPPLPERQGIASIFNALDDKIELNRKMNRTLGEIAQAIFKSWFINFDGVPPEDLVGSEVGPIPVAWSVGSLKDVAEHIRDTVQPGSLDSDTPYVGLEHVPRRCATLDTWGTASDVTSAKARFEHGDVLFGKLRPYFHKVVPAPCSGIASTDILVIRPKSESWHPFVFCHLFSDPMIAHASAATDGTKMPRTKWTDLCRFPVAMPPANMAARFECVVTPIFKRMVANMRESRTLVELRDTLLPKLISGEIRVPEAGQALEATA